jgi:hypothetical protein
MTEQPSRADRRRPGHENLPAVPAVRGKTTGLLASPNPRPRQQVPNDMQPKQVDRAEIKKRRKVSRRNRRKR